MALQAGSKLGPYEIVAPLGAGGMGEVYRARDTRLDRTVAVKILPADIQASPERKQRFEREAKAISSLQHPHICVLHDVGCQDGMDYLVMEYLEGESLADRLRRGPLPTEQTLKLGIEIADALEKAHKQGLVHRDLKPGNVMLTKSGAKLLDFGLAKSAAVIAAAAAAEFEGATLTNQRQHPVTAQGVVVGTFRYMSPEQVQGGEADGRSDIFAFGALLYECATGKPAFTGKTQISLMSAILERQPESITVLNATSPPALEYVIRTCLQKDPDDRFQTAHDVSLQLKWIAGSTTAALALPGPRGHRRRWLQKAGWVVAAAMLVVVAVLLSWRRESGPEHVLRFSIAMPARQSIPVDVDSLAISPDGTKVAYVSTENGDFRLYVRPLDQFDSIPIGNSEGASFPFFSPDSRMVAFFAHGRLRKVSADGSTVPVPVMDMQTFFGGQWLPDGRMVVSQMKPGLGIISADGSSLQPIQSKGEQLNPGNPLLLPGGEWLLFTQDKVASFSVYALRMATGETRELMANAVLPMYVPGYLLYYSSGSLWAAPFDAKRASLTGPAVVVAQEVAARNWFAHYAISQNGAVVYAPGAGLGAAHNLVWVDRKGNTAKVDVPPEDYVDPSISPDGKHFVICVRKLTEQALAIYDMTRGVLMRMSGNRLRSAAPVWSGDGKEILFDSAGATKDAGDAMKFKQGIYRMPADGSAEPVLVRGMSTYSHVTAVSGNTASLMINDPSTNYDLWSLSLDGKEMKPFRKTAAGERQGSFSPDGKYLAYASDESGRSEVYVEAAAGSGARWQISTNGGEQPRWSRKGNEIFYRNGTKMMTVAVQMTPFTAGKPEELFDGNFDRGGAVPGYDVTPDGQRFLMTQPERPNPTELRVVIGWPEALKKTGSPARQ